MRSTEKAAKERGSRRAEDVSGLDDELRRWIDDVIVPAMLAEFFQELQADGNR